MVDTLAPDRALRVPEVAVHLRCSEGQVYRLVADGRLRAFRVGRMLRIRESAIAEFIQRQEG